MMDKETVKEIKELIIKKRNCARNRLEKSTKIEDIFFYQTNVRAYNDLIITIYLLYEMEDDKEVKEIIENDKRRMESSN